MKNKTVKIISFIMSAFLLVYAGYQVWGLFYKPYKTEISVNYTVNDAMHVSGIAVRTEIMIEENYSGSVSYVYRDAERVLRNSIVAYTHSSADTVDKMTECEKLQKDISLLKSASTGVQQLYGFSEYINDQIGSAVIGYAGAVSGNDYSGFQTAQDDLLLSINEKTVLTGKENRFEERITSLQAQYDELQIGIAADASDTIKSPKTGYFISAVDGFENLINKENIFEKTVAEVEAIIGQETVASEQVVGKIADNYKWLYAFTVSAKEAESFKEGAKLSVNIDGITNSLDMSVEKIVSDESSENTMIILECEMFNSALAALRRTDADIVFSTITGLRVSKDALRFDSEQNKGVYILDRGEVKFRKIDIAYEGSDYYVTKWKKGNNEYLQLFDEVFTGGRDLYVGKTVD